MLLSDIFIPLTGIDRVVSSCSLLAVIGTMSERRVTELMDAMLLMTAVECVRSAIRDERTIDYFISDIDTTRNLIKGTNNCFSPSSTHTRSLSYNGYSSISFDELSSHV